jgi:hypothetical protein
LEVYSAEAFPLFHEKTEKQLKECESLLTQACRVTAGDPIIIENYCSALHYRRAVSKGLDCLALSRLKTSIRGSLAAKLNRCQTRGAIGAGVSRKVI